MRSCASTAEGDTRSWAVGAEGSFNHCVLTVAPRAGGNSIAGWVSEGEPDHTLREVRANRVRPGVYYIIAVDIDPFGFPPGVDPNRFRLNAPYTNDSRVWSRLRWRNQYDPDGPSYRINPYRPSPVQPGLVLVKSYGHVLSEYRVHPEHKSFGPDDEPCRRATASALRPVTPVEVRYIGKEANRLDDVRAGVAGDLGEVINGYSDPKCK